MAGIAAILAFDGRSPESDEAAALLGAGARIPDAVIEAASADGGALARLYAPTTTTDPPGQPLIDSHSGSALVFAGRLDNRDELLVRLSLDPSTSDAAVVHAAVQRWDAEAPANLLGDFAFIHWDPRRRRGLIARDHFGVLTLYFHASPSGVVCASELAQVLAHGRVPRRPDLGCAAAFLAQETANGPATLFDGVSRVPPAHAVIFSEDRVRLVRYWTLEPRPRTPRKTDDEYAEEARELLFASVRCRLRSQQPVATTLSGGLDSSAVTVAAHNVREAAPASQSFGLVFPQHPETDERDFIQAVGMRLDAAPRLVEARACDPAVLARWAADWLDMPATAADVIAVPMWTAMKDAGHRVALTGVAGDLVFAGAAFGMADLLRERRMAEVGRRWNARRTSSGMRRATVDLVQTGLWPLLPASMRRTLRPLAWHVLRTSGSHRRDDWLLLQKPERPLSGPPRGGSFAGEQLVRELTSGTHSYFVEMAGRVARGAGIELRHPLLDIRLAQFAMDLPDEQRQRRDIDRYVLRRALQSHLPRKILDRRTKADFAQVVKETFEILGGETYFRNLSIGAAGWVDPPRVLQLYRAMAAGFARGPDVYGDYVPQLWWITAVDHWHREAF